MHDSFLCFRLNSKIEALDFDVETAAEEELFIHADVCDLIKSLFYFFDIWFLKFRVMSSSVNVLQIAVKDVNMANLLKLG